MKRVTRYLALALACAMLLTGGDAVAEENAGISSLAFFCIAYNHAAEGLKLAVLEDMPEPVDTESGPVAMIVADQWSDILLWTTPSKTDVARICAMTKLDGSDDAVDSMVRTFIAAMVGGSAIPLGGTKEGLAILTELGLTDPSALAVGAYGETVVESGLKISYVVDDGRLICLFVAANS